MVRQCQLSGAEENIRTTSLAHYPFGVAVGVGIPPAARPEADPQAFCKLNP